MSDEVREVVEGDGYAVGSLDGSERATGSARCAASSA